MTSTQPGLLDGRDRDRLACELAPLYADAAPWPHLVIDDLVGVDRAARVEAAELPFARDMPAHRSQRVFKSESPVPGSDEARSLLAELTLPDFVSFLQDVTGIADLLPDPTHFWAGIYASGPGFFQSVHSDFARHPQNNLFHRLNVLVYLNTDWQPEFGGDLELWTRDLGRCAKRVEPVAGRMVVFESTGTSYHGLPEPLDVPAGRLRLVLAAHYYTVKAPVGYRRPPLVRRPRRPQDPWWDGFISPRPVIDGVRAALRDTVGSTPGRRH